MPKFTVAPTEADSVPADVLLLLYPQAWSPAARRLVDRAVERGVPSLAACAPPPDELRILPTEGRIAPKTVAVLGTTAVEGYRYVSLTGFVGRAMDLLGRRGERIGRVATIVDGGESTMDRLGVLQFLAAGFDLRSGDVAAPTEVVFAEPDARTAETLAVYLRGLQDARTAGPAEPSPATADSLAGSRGHIFVAMPFAEEFDDTYEFGIRAPSHHCGFLCEHVGRAVFTGDILNRILDRIRTAKLVVADLTGGRPNVYLEVGYAWGCGVPVLIVARKGELLHFDVSRHRCIHYSSIRHLSDELRRMLTAI